MIAFIFVNTIQYPSTLNNNIYHSNKREPPPFFIRIPILDHILVHSVGKTNALVVTVEVIYLFFLNVFFSTLFQHRTNLLGSLDSEETM